MKEVHLKAALCPVRVLKYCSDLIPPSSTGVAFAAGGSLAAAVVGGLARVAADRLARSFNKAEAKEAFA